jgi:hypothetical protein
MLLRLWNYLKDQYLYYECTEKEISEQQHCRELSILRNLLVGKSFDQAPWELEDTQFHLEHIQTTEQEFGDHLPVPRIIVEVDKNNIITDVINRLSLQ